MAAGYLRFPHLHGDLVTFVAEDDIWIAPIGGGRAWRLSADGAPASHPRFSPDGRWIAWTSRRDGDAEIHLAPAEGGTGRRLTYWGTAKTRMCGWSPGGDVLAISSVRQPFWHHTWAYAVPLDAGAPVRLPYGPVEDLCAGEDTAVLLTAGSREPAHWKRYRGGGTGRLWIRRDGATMPVTTPLLTGLGGHLDSVLLVDGRIAFLSDHEGTGDLYSCDLDGTGLRRHTHWPDFYARNAATDGRRVVLQVAGRLWILDDLDSPARPLDIVLGGPRPARRPRLVTAADDLGGLSCDHEGRASAIEVQGTVHWLTHRDGPARTLAADPAVRARAPRVLGDTGQVVWVSDAGGRDGLEIAPASGLFAGTTGADDPADGTAEPAGPAGPAVAIVPRRIASGRLGWVEDLAASPDGTAVAVAARDGRLLVVEVASGEVRELARSDDGPVAGLAFSPDSAWLAWSQPGPDPLRRIRMARLADATVIDVTDARFVDDDPVFTLDGRYLAFLSWRGFDPVYDIHVFDLSFPFGCRPYLVPLAAGTPSPFAPSPDGRPVDASAEPSADPSTGPSAGPSADVPADASQDGPAGGKPGTGSSGAVTVDLEGLPGRVVPFPVEAASYASMRAVKGGVVWLRVPLSGTLGESGAEPDGDRPRPALERFDFGKRSCEVLVDALSDFQVSGDGNRIVVRDRARLRVVPSSHRRSADDDDDAFTVDLGRARTTADPAAQWRHAYEEAGRIVRHEFWAPDLSGVDWDEVLGRYRPLLDRVAGPDDFADLLWEVLGELGTSHAYVQAGLAAHRRDPEPVGLLGADLEPGDDGLWRVVRVLPGESSDPRARSPLMAPAAGVRPGDALLAIDGRPVDRVAGPGPLLVGTAGKPVELTIGPHGGGPARRVAVVPLADDERLRYQAWVADRRARVRELSGGRLGYLHIPDMMGAGWAQFHRDLRVEMPRDALIVDLRGNRGGHVSQLVVEKLARRVIGWDVPRGRRPATYPYDAPRGPLVAIADEHAGSDGDIIAAAIQSLRLGKVVGTRTWGGVIGIDGWHRLIDGSMITVPRYATWFADRGWDLENHGVDPDVEIVVTPDDWAAGRDPQLETAVEIALAEIDRRPPVVPPALPGSAEPV